MDMANLQQMLADYNVIALGTRLLGAIVIFLIGRWIGKRIVSAISKNMEKRGIDALLVAFVSNILGVLMLVVVLMIALGHLGIQLTPLIAILGGMALAIGLALQSS